MRSRLLAALVAGTLCALLCLLLVPAVVNGDGLGYLKAAPTGIYYPGHLGYLPLLRFLGRLTGRSGSLALLAPARALSVIACGIGVAAFHGAARRLLDRSPGDGARGALYGAIGFAVSFGALQVGSDVETYAPALSAMCIGLYCAVRRQSGGGARFVAATAVAVAVAALLHVENVLFAPAAALLCARPCDDDGVDGRWRRGDGLAVLFGSGALVLTAYLAAFHFRRDTPLSALRWFFGAGHGYAHPLRLSTPLIALYGMAKTLVYAPYPHQAPWASVVGQTLAGVAGLAALLWLARRNARKKVLRGGVGAAWIIPYLLVGVAFFASDNERWVFLLPPAWLVASAGAATSRRASFVAAGLVSGLFVLDVTLGVALARDDEIRVRADAVAADVSPNDLVISPGHSWDEYIGFYQSIPLEHFPMIYFCGDLGGAAAMKRELAHRVVDARARHAGVFLARVDEPDGADGWKELALFGITPANVDALLPPGHRVPIAPGLVRLDP